MSNEDNRRRGREYYSIEMKEFRQNADSQNNKSNSTKRKPDNDVT